MTEFMSTHTHNKKQFQSILSTKQDTQLNTPYI